MQATTELELEGHHGQSLTMDNLVHELNGRWIVAYWDARRSQWISSNRPRLPLEQSYCYSFGLTLASLARVGIRTYARRGDAVCAATRLYDHS